MAPSSHRLFVGRLAVRRRLWWPTELLGHPEDRRHAVMNTPNEFRDSASIRSAAICSHLPATAPAAQQGSGAGAAERAVDWWAWSLFAR